MADLVAAAPSLAAAAAAVAATAVQRPSRPRQPAFPDGVSDPKRAPVWILKMMVTRTMWQRRVSDDELAGVPVCLHACLRIRLLF